MKNYFRVLLIITVILSCNSDREDLTNITYYENGSIDEIIYQNFTTFQGKKKTNTIILDYYENGKLELIRFKKDTLLSGPFIVYDSLGRLKSYNNYYAGKPEGHCFTFFINGNLKISTIYKNGILLERFKYDSIGGHCDEYQLCHNGQTIKSLKFNRTGLIKKQLIYIDPSTKLKYTEQWDFYNNNKTKRYIKYCNSEDYNYRIENKYDTISGTLLETPRFLDYRFKVESDSISIEPFIDYRFDKLSNYSIKIINTTYKNNNYAVKKNNNIFRLRAENKMSWTYEICDSIGCFTIPITFDNSFKDRKK